MTRLLLAFPLALSLQGTALAEPRAEQIADCPTIDACLSILEGSANNPYGVWWEGNEEIAASLRERFGEQAREALLKLALSDRGESQNLAGGVLSVWGEWRPEHVPQLAAALEARSNGWIARPLGEIRTPEAIDALVADLARGASDGQTDWVLGELGPLALERILPALEQADDPRYDGEDRSLIWGAQSLIGGMGAGAIPAAAGWLSIALDPAQPQSLRLAALRGLAAIGEPILDQASDVRGLLQSTDSDLADEAYLTLAAMGDPIVADRALEECLASAELANSAWLLPRDRARCLGAMSSFKTNTASVSALLAPYLADPSSEVRTAAIFSLGELRAAGTAGQITASLGSSDWREVVAALQALDWFGYEQSLDAIRRVESEYWWPPIRQLASAARVSIEGGGTPLEETLSDDIFVERSSRYVRDEPPVCPSQQWRWGVDQFSFTAADRAEDHVLEFDGGQLIGVDAGEWIGHLSWKPNDGSSVVLWSDNITLLLSSPNGAMAAASLNHLGPAYGYLLRAELTADVWSASYLGQLPGDFAGYATLANDRIAIMSEGWAVVAGEAGIEGVATCAD